MLLSKEEYLTLQERRSDFHSAATQQHTRSFQPVYFSKVSEIHERYFNERIDGHCGACVIQGFSRLWGKIEEYEAEEKRVIDEQAKVLEDASKDTTYYGKGKKSSWNVKK
jgi:hypothetical protein